MIVPSDQAFTPLRDAGLVHYAATVEACNRLRHIAAVQIRIGGVLRVLTITLVPSHRYNLPFFVTDLVCLGSRRIAAFQIIDPVPTDGEYDQKDYPQLRACKARAAARFPTQNLVSGSDAPSFLQDCSIAVRTD